MCIVLFALTFFKVNLRGYVNRIFAAITCSAMACPTVMCQVFHNIKETATMKFPGKKFSSLVIIIEKSQKLSFLWLKKSLIIIMPKFMFNLGKNQNDYLMIWVVWSFALLYVGSTASTKGRHQSLSVHQCQALLEEADNWMGKDMEKTLCCTPGRVKLVSSITLSTSTVILYSLRLTLVLNPNWGFSPGTRVPPSSNIKIWLVPPREPPETFPSN